jgi:outer membrane protein OmpA-like peptidoglycan-associated protein
VWVFLAVLFVAVSAAGVARADGFDGQRFQPAAGAAGGLDVERAMVPRHLGFGFGFFLHYGYDAVVDRDRPANVTRHVLHHGLTIDFMGSLGLGDIFEIAFVLPVDVLWQGDPTNFGGQTIATGAGIGDIRLVPKLAWQFGGVDLNYGIGVMTPISFPSGSELALRGAGGVTLDPTLLASLGGWRWNFTLNFGFAWRSGHGQAGSIAGDDELHFGLAGTFALVLGKVGLDLIAEFDGGYQPHALQSGTIAVPMEALGALVIKPGRSWSIYFGGGGGLDNGLGTPDARVLAGVRYQHRVPNGNDRFKDSDHDGIKNGWDDCPNTPEDEDGFQDDDGCPEADNDHDGVDDDHDECPDVAGPASNEGCPERGRVVWRRGRIVIFGKVHFETGSARIQKRSHALLDQIAVMVKEHPEVGHIRVEGYTDNVGPPDVNLRLSRERADSVRAALIERGVAAHRLRTQGFGETHPVAPNRTRAGRAKNRRVEFVASK